jgi:hypothetical protein
MDLYPARLSKEQRQRWKCLLNAPEGTIRAKLRAASCCDHVGPALIGLTFALVSIVTFEIWKSENELGATALFDVVIPFGAGSALLVAFTLGVRQLIRHSEHKCCRSNKFPRFGRKGLITTSTSILVVASCFYRSTFIASEGAALCRGKPSYNAPFAGRTTATAGEIAFVVQVAAYI